VSGRRGQSPGKVWPAPEPLRWGWHRLSDSAAARVVAAAQIRPGDLVVDIGAGEGALTEPLLRAGARVVAVELHPGRCQTLRARFADDPVAVVQADAGRFQWPRGSFRVVANPPYAVWVALLRSLLARNSALLSADVVLQRRVVRRLVAAGASPPQRRGGRYVLERGIAVPRSSFRPPPRVDSAVLRVSRRPRWSR
jgi:23S rRNA (adenine-N6)-dimethyltransferase